MAEVVDPSRQVRDVYSVSRLNREVKWLLADSFPRLWIEGEISNLARPASGHWYFSLKDAKAQVRCAMFRRHNQNLGFVPENGLQVLVKAQVSLYEPRGDYQLLVETMEPAGDGALRRAFEDLKQRLAAEGLFAAEHKRPLPAWPERIGVITSPTGAAIRDVLTVLRRRFAALEVILYPCQVQGEQAGREIVAALERANRHGVCDVLLLVRGGASLEDLWPFNGEQVARAIRASRIPVVTGIGHEIDFTIADFAADHRAPTPSAAAETVSPDGEAVTIQIRRLRESLHRAVQRQLGRLEHNTAWLARRLHVLHPRRRLSDHAQHLNELEARLRRAQSRYLQERRQPWHLLRHQLLRHHPQQRLQRHRQSLTTLRQRLHQSQAQRLSLAHTRLGTLSRTLATVGPLATLERGYALVTDTQGHVLTAADQVRPGDAVEVRLARGRLHCRVEKTGR
ncbi:exodeoxyribonuclease VII large subunit [Methylomarinovum tepidoasis]|uniref:Exodeoxyribonuclease 7 large subunit n=1 Tax=Methylomarinovum tepidoasis TaxID=2840183 RepID=A0AAU9CKD0_9GAMM|nr:exodeoxyribonuclease VII large subunit [Methylomarinovum sp. IN45]BCX88102.1 exodeoxyribonuclease VII large subunit [Methylomarinovum sp. IN45]